MSKHQFKILSLDGGGIKGIIPCTVLKYIEEKVNQPISSLFDVIAGTSTGGIISVGLTKGNKYGGNAFSASDMLNLYVENGKYIFSKRPSDLKAWIGSFLDGLFDKAYDVKKFENILAEKFSDSKLKDSLTDVLVTTYVPEKEKPFYFSSRLAKTDENENFLLNVIARSTSAAPTYFKPSKVTVGNDKLGFVDGGVFANNPSILAYCEAKEIWKTKDIKIEVRIPDNLDKGTKAFEAVVTPDDLDVPFYMLSIGCGHCPTSINFSEADDWRIKDWIKPLLSNVFMQSVAESTHYTMQYLLPPFSDGTRRYQRLDLAIPEKNCEMDDTSDKNISELCDIAETYVKENKAELDDICQLLTS